ncbi:YfcC family protein [Atopobacter sp. AH10]|uniref:YfcC family protein n=1 Tax=Atopobacter sp. AH10 TaxID=2315861 RepID=UPI000EF219A6|nr:YfcC family protein [Atopobacter sp. AH10]RLK63377.1 YfcC family protein [Atopobacter sp. AH10]
MATSEKAKKKRSFPTAFTVLFMVLVLAAVLTWVVPAGSFERLTYTEDGQFQVTAIDGSTKTEKASQKTLDKYHINIPLKSFKEGAIRKPIAIPGTYKRIEQKPQGFASFILAPISGIGDSVGIIVFVLILGGVIGVVNKSGAFDAAMAALSRKTKGHEFMLVVIVCSLIAVGGTTYGMAEETIAFYPILLPIFLAAGYDALVGIAAIYLGSTIGTMFSTTNPFSVVIASNAAGINFASAMPIRLVSLVLAQIVTLIFIGRYAKKVKADPSKSLIYADKERIEEVFLKNYDPNKVVPFDARRKLILIIFALAFPVMIWGVSIGGWWFEELSAVFLTAGLIIMAISGLSEKDAVNTFIAGAADLVGVALIIGVARGINMIMDQGMISDTLLEYTSRAVDGMNSVLFSTTQAALFSILGIFIPSSSGLATLSMPIMAPLADAVHLSRDVVVSAYNYGQGWMSFITPTGLILASLEMVGVTYDKWLKFVLPLMMTIGALALVMLGIQTML